MPAHGTPHTEVAFAVALAVAHARLAAVAEALAGLHAAVETLGAVRVARAERLQLLLLAADGAERHQRGEHARD